MREKREIKKFSSINVIQRKKTKRILIEEDGIFSSNEIKKPCLFRKNL